MRSSPAFAPSSCSSKPGTSASEPSSTVWSRALPPSKGSPSMRPTKSIVTKWPRAAAVSSGSSTSVAWRWRRRSSSRSTSSSLTAVEGRRAGRPVTSPSSIGGRTSMRARYEKAPPSPGGVASTAGSLTGSSPLRSSAAGSVSDTSSRSTSSATAGP
jgi:hypothetical protein